MKHKFQDIRPFARDPLNFLLTKSERAAEGLVPLALGISRIFLVNDAELLQPILKAPEKLIDKGRLERKLEPILGRSTLTLSGAAHAMRREALHEALGRGVVESLVPELLGEIRRAMFQLMRQSSFDAHAFGAGLALKLICTVLFGHQVLSEADEQALIGSVRSVEQDVSDEMFRVFPQTPWTKYMKDCKRPRAREVMGAIFKKVERRAGDKSVFRTLHRIGLPEDEIHDEILTLLLAGHHTTGSAIAWAMYYMAVNNTIKYIIAQEADACLLFDGDIDQSKLKSAQISMSLAKETLRLFPSTWWFSREVVSAHYIGDQKVEPGDALIISPWVFH